MTNCPKNICDLTNAYLPLLSWLVGSAPCLVILGPTLTKPTPVASPVTVVGGRRWYRVSRGEFSAFLLDGINTHPFMNFIGHSGSHSHPESKRVGACRQTLCPERGEFACSPNVYHICIISFLMKEEGKAKWENWSSDLYSNIHESLISIWKLFTHPIPHLNKTQSALERLGGLVG